MSTRQEETEGIKQGFTKKTEATSRGRLGSRFNRSGTVIIIISHYLTAATSENRESVQIMFIRMLVSCGFLSIFINPIFDFDFEPLGAQPC